MLSLVAHCATGMSSGYSQKDCFVRRMDWRCVAKRVTKRKITKGENEMAKRPNYRVVAKSKASGKFQDIAAFWIGDKGISGQLDKAIEKIVLTNGTVIKPDTCYFNLQENKDESSEQQSGGSSHQSQPEEDGSIPF